MFSLFKRKNEKAIVIYNDIIDAARNPILYTDYNVSDTPMGRFQMIALHSAPYFIDFKNKGQGQMAQDVFDKIFNDIELSFREIGVGDLAVPKKMKRYMKDFNGIIQAHAAANADHVDITRRNVFGDDGIIIKEFEIYIKGLFANGY
jgi:cytochrome b pre-mRNA-processing protein 3